MTDNPEGAASVRARAEQARAAALALARAPHGSRVAALGELAKRLASEAPAIVEANVADLADARASGLAKPLLDRLKLTPEKLATLAEGVRQVAALPDPVDRTVRSTRLDDGLELFQVTTPLGVLACVFESRPDAVVQIAALAVKSGNAVLLKGGAEAARSNDVLARLARDALRAADLPQDAVQLLSGRAEVAQMLKHDDLVDLVIPRGSSAFVKHVMASTRIPVLGHAEGVCHVYVDKAADLAKALAIALDAKLDYPAACNAAECFLLHRDVAPAFAPVLKGELAKRGVEVSEDPADYGREFGDLRCALAVVGSVEEAISFVNRHGSKHTDAIVTEDPAAARAFVTGVDAAGVFVNASTRFADGFRYGLGAEVGVSTSKIHARGPVGLEGLVTTKWVLAGNGQGANEYGPGKKSFQHAPGDRSKPPFW